MIMDCELQKHNLWIWNKNKYFTVMHFEKSNFWKYERIWTMKNIYRVANSGFPCGITGTGFVGEVSVERDIHHREVKSQLVLKYK